MSWKGAQYFFLLSGMVAAAITPFSWLTFNERDAGDNLFKVIVATVLSLVGTCAFVLAALAIRKHFYKKSEHWIQNFAAGGVSFLMSFASVWLAVVVWGEVSPEMVLFYMLILMAYWVCFLLMVVIYKPSALR